MHFMDNGQGAHLRHQDYMLQTGQWSGSGSAETASETPEEFEARLRRTAEARAAHVRREAAQALRAEQWAPVLPTVIPRFLQAMDAAGRPGLEPVYFFESHGMAGWNRRSYNGYALPAVAGDAYNIEQSLDRHTLVVSTRGNTQLLWFSEGKPRLDIGISKHAAKRWDNRTPDFERTTVELHDRLRAFAASQGVEFDLTPLPDDGSADHIVWPSTAEFAQHMAPECPGGEAKAVFERHRGKEQDTGREIVAWPIRIRTFDVSGPGGYPTSRSASEWVGADGQMYHQVEVAPAGWFSSTPRQVLFALDNVAESDALPALLRLKAARWGKPFAALESAGARTEP